MTRDQLEFAISQYLDGTLPLLEAAALEERLATDADVRALLEEYRKLDVALKTTLPLPEIKWDRLASHLSRAIATEEPPMRHYSLVAWRRGANVALAACVALVVGIGFMSYRSSTSRTSPIAPVAIVVGPQQEVAADFQPVAQVAIGPAPSLSDSWRYAETVISRPAVVMIDRGARSGQDSDSIWY